MTTKFQELLAQYLRDQARWRRYKAEEFPDDDRNLRAADGLLEMAGYVLGLPPDGERLAALQRANDRLGGDDYFEPGESANYDIARFRFHDPTMECATFLDWLVEVVPASIEEYFSMYGDEV